jgi:hypothetical protein
MQQDMEVISYFLHRFTRNSVLDFYLLNAKSFKELYDFEKELT